MFNSPLLKQWMSILSPHFSGVLSFPQLKGLVTWSLGIALSGSSSLTQVSVFIAELNAEKELTVKQRLKEWYQEKTAKKGGKRAQLEVSLCFAPLLAWIISLFPPTTQDLKLAMDATNIGSLFSVLSIHVLYRSSAIPVAWDVVIGGEKGAWKPIWLKLFKQLENSVPEGFRVTVSADRGLYADWVFEAITNLGWHPLLRINHHQGLYQLSKDDPWQPLSQLLPEPGLQWSGSLYCFKSHPLHCTLLGRWEQGYEEPWLILTDLPASEASAVWYGFRSWIEGGYRDIKSDGFDWQHTRLSDPTRAQRLGLAMAVAMVWQLSVGATAEAQQSEPELERLPEAHTARKTRKSKAQNKSKRSISCFLRGGLTLLARLLNGFPISLDTFFDEPLPDPSLIPVPILNSS